MTDQPPLPRPAHLRRPGLIPDITLSEFLRARLDEEQELAEERLYGERWTCEHHVGDEYNYGHVRDERGNLVADAGPIDGVNPADYRAQHIARHDPARVLAEVEAKRRIIECEIRPSGYQALASVTMRLLALPYSDHPDYRAEDWAP